MAVLFAAAPQGGLATGERVGMIAQKPVACHDLHQDSCVDSDSAFWRPLMSPDAATLNEP